MDPRDNPLNTIPENVQLGEIDMDEVIFNVSDSRELIKLAKDQLRLKLHLAEMDAKDLRAEIMDKMDGIQKNLAEHEAQLRQTTDHLKVQGHLGLIEAQEIWENTREFASKAVDAFKEDKQKATQLMQELKLQGHLAKLDLKDAHRAGAGSVLKTAQRFRSSLKEFVDELKH